MGRRDRVTDVEQPVYIVFAGINGAGKSTLYRSGIWRKCGFELELERINPDEILRDRGLDPADARAQITAGREAVRRIDECLAAGRSFNQETTLSGRSSVMTIKRAKQLGYRVVLYYVGVESVEVAQRRVAHRAELGGHDIAPELVRRRFDRSMDNLIKVVGWCDEVHLFDNTLLFEHIATVRDGLLSMNRTAPIADWARELAERIERAM